MGRDLFVTADGPACVVHSANACHDSKACHEFGAVHRQSHQIDLIESLGSAGAVTQTVRRPQQVVLNGSD